MKAKLFGQFISALAQLLEDFGAHTQSRGWLSLLPIFDGKPSDSVKDVCKELSEINLSSGSDGATIEDLILILPAVNTFLKQSAKKAIIDDFNLFAGAISPLARFAISDLVDAVSRKRAGHTEPVADVISRHLNRLGDALTDEANFLKAFNTLKVDKSLKAADIRLLAREFTRQSAKSKADAFERIWDRHASLIAAGARAKVTGSRTAG
jgi:hypothetical protein